MKTIEKNLKPKLFFYALFLFVFFFSSCKKDDDNEKEDCRFLTEALAKAKTVIDIEMPGAVLWEILGDSIESDGSSSEGWTFNYIKQVQKDDWDYYEVQVSPDGQLFHYNPGGTPCPNHLPSYTSASVLAWVTKGDGIMANLGKPRNYMELQVFVDYCVSDYATADNVVILYYFLPNDRIYYIIMNADTNNILDQWEDNR